MSGRSQVWESNVEDLPRSESFSFCLYSLFILICTVISKTLKLEGLLVFPTEANSKEALKQEETKQKTRWQECGGFTSKRSSEPAEIAEPVVGRAEETRSFKDMERLLRNYCV